MGRETRNDREAKSSSAADEKKNTPSTSKGGRNQSIALTNWNGNNDSIMNTIFAMTAKPKTSAHDAKDKNTKGDKTGGNKKNTRATAKESYCEGCGDAGEKMVSCKSCSVHYHPVCDDPPLEESVQDSNWQCKSCRHKELFKSQNYVDFNLDLDGNGTSASAIKEKSQSEDAVSSKSEKEKEPVVKGRKKAPPVEVIELSCEDDDFDVVNVKQPRSYSWQKQELKRTFNLLITGSKTMHPTSFDIPIDFRHHYKFPGTSRKALIESGVKLQPKVVHIENAAVPRPTALCYHCNKSSRLAALLKCDYCPKFFHLDCLLPPLTSVPGGLWMCPLHPEPFLECTKLQNAAISSRVKIWDSTHRPLDGNVVVTSFFRKCQRKEPPYARRSVFLKKDFPDVPKGSGNALENSFTIEDHTKFMNEVMAAECPEPTSDEYLAKKAKLFECYETNESVTESSSANKRKFTVPETTGAKDLYNDVHEIRKPPLKPVLRKYQASTSEKKSQSSSSISKRVSDREAETVPNAFSNSDKEDKTATNNNKNQEETNTNEDNAVEGLFLLTEATQFLEKKEIDQHMKAQRRDEYLKNLAYEEVLKLAGERLKDIDEKAESAKYGNRKKTVRIHAFKIEAAARPEIPMAKPTAVKYLLELYFKDLPKKLKLKSTSLVIGTVRPEEDCPSFFDPTLFVDCKCISKRHALIFFDRMRLQWEILNYSMYGVIVDDVLYSIRPSVVDNEPVNEIEEMKTRILRRRGILVETRHNPHYPTDDSSDEAWECPCQEDQESVVSEVTHEGSAVIAVGSRIQIGCLKLTVAKMDVEEDV